MKKLFRVFDVDDYGKEQNCIGVFEALDEQDAKKIASEKFHNEEIAEISYYQSKETSVEEMKADEIRTNETTANMIIEMRKRTTILR